MLKFKLVNLEQLPAVDVLSEPLFVKTIPGGMQPWTRAEGSSLSESCISFLSHNRATLLNPKSGGRVKIFFVQNDGLLVSKNFMDLREAKNFLLARWVLVPLWGTDSSIWECPLFKGIFPLWKSLILWGIKESFNFSNQKNALIQGHFLKEAEEEVLNFFEHFWSLGSEFLTVDYIPLLVIEGDIRFCNKDIQEKLAHIIQAKTVLSKLKIRKIIYRTQGA